jgi:hypothetical protein
MRKKRSIGQEIIEGLKELNDTLKKGEPLEKRFRVTKIVKQDDGTYKVIRNKCK